MKVSKTNSFEFKRNFQMFEIVDQNRVLIINDNQAFVILFDITKGRKITLFIINSLNAQFLLINYTQEIFD